MGINKEKNFHFVVLLASALVVIATFLIQTRGKSVSSGSGGHTVELGPYGFFPEEITIKKGDTVTFVTTRNEPFWPASNSHPVHDVYPEFDPKRALKPSEIWSFTFNNVGEWGFHDHLGSYYSTDEGMVRVVEGDVDAKDFDTKPGVAQEVRDCSGEDEKKKCWVNNLKAIMAKEGLKASFEHIAQLYAADPEFATTCNDITHYMGGFAYRLFKNDKESVVIPESTYCALGFYHGFLEVWFHNYPKTEEAIAFCDYVEEKLGEDQPLAIGNCYHGIGHGAYHMYHIGDWDNFARSMEPVFAICEKTDELLNCLDGVFNAVNMDYYETRYKYLDPKENPFRYCEELGKYKKECYDGFAGVLVWGDESKLPDALSSLKDIEDLENAKAALVTIMQVQGFNNTTQTDHKMVIDACRSLKPELKDTCIKAYAEGLMEQGEPGKEGEVGFAFCNSNHLTESERTFCLDVVDEFSSTYFKRNG